MADTPSSSIGALAPTTAGLPGAALGLATGLVQDVKAAKLKKQADAMFPDYVDPNQSAFLAELGQKRKSIDTGADFATGMNAIDNTGTATNEALTRNTGGDAASTIQSLLMSQKNTANAKNSVLAQGQQQQQFYNQQYGDLLDKISSRKLQLQLQQSAQKRAEWAQMKQGANQNLMAGAGGIMSLGQGGGSNTPSPNDAGSAEGTGVPGSVNSGASAEELAAVAV